MSGITFKYFEEKVSYETAKTRCTEWGGALASLNTIRKIDFVDGMIPDDTKVWIGGQCTNCKTVKDDSWVWASGDRLDLQNPYWGTNLPKDDR